MSIPEELEKKTVAELKKYSEENTKNKPRAANEPVIERYRGKGNIIDFYANQIREILRTMMGTYYEVSINESFKNNLIKEISDNFIYQARRLPATRDYPNQCFELAKGYVDKRYVEKYTADTRIQLLENANLEGLLLTFNFNVGTAELSLPTKEFFSDKNIEALKEWCVFLQQSGNAGELAFAMKKLADNEKRGLEWFRNTLIRINTLKHNLGKLTTKRTQEKGWLWRLYYNEESELKEAIKSFQKIITVNRSQLALASNQISLPSETSTSSLESRRSSVSSQTSTSSSGSETSTTSSGPNHEEEESKDRANPMVPH